MCDGLESMFIDLHKKDDITHLIKKENYWGFKKQTFRNFLIKTNNKIIKKSRFLHQNNK